ncbi:MAG TPA: hypothetical protein VNT79_12940, partial [Phycisphaerae bacterium]|nr:hypothetical protein [Phycisphaerae bacterium]
MRKANTAYQGAADAFAFASWVATPDTTGAKSRLLQFPSPKNVGILSGFNAVTLGQVAIGGGDTRDIAPSSAISGHFDPGVGAIVRHWEAAFSDDLRPTSQRGLLRLLDSAATGGDQVRCCDGASAPCSNESCAVQYTVWNPCIAHRDDSTSIIVWSEKEDPGLVAPVFNIALRIYKPDGTVVVSIDRDSTLDAFQSVNEPIRDMALSDQISPAVDIDACGNIVVVWVGPVAHEKSDPGSPCTTEDDLAVYARRLYYNDGAGVGPPSLTFLGSQFHVDSSGEEWSLGSTLENVHPTVALLQSYKQSSSDEQLQGRVFIAWNAIHRDTAQRSVRGQFLHPDGRRWGPEVDVSPYLDAQTEEPDGIDRMLGESNQHTIAYASHDHQAFATWTADDGTNTNVWFTRFKESFLYELEAHGMPICVKGDMDTDGVVSGDLADIPLFVDFLLSDVAVCISSSDLDFCRADTNSDGAANGADVQCFTDIHLGDTWPCSGDNWAVDCTAEGFEAVAAPDCNENDVWDWLDIVYGTSVDCNGNGIPDECDIASEESDDINENAIPDDCETDCDGSGTPDDYDLANCSNDPACLDCNENDILDGCESDCNDNDVVDECDVDPTDPDGDNQVSED